MTHACEPCRHRKTKCSGERPTCRHCQDFKIACYYADGKRDRVKKCVPHGPQSKDKYTDGSRQFGTMAEKVADYEKLLKELSLRVNDGDAELIRVTLERVSILYGCGRREKLTGARKQPVMLTMPL